MAVISNCLFKVPIKQKSKHNLKSKRETMFGKNIELYCYLQERLKKLGFFWFVVFVCFGLFCFGLVFWGWFGVCVCCLGFFFSFCLFLCFFFFLCILRTSGYCLVTDQMNCCTFLGGI